MHGWLFVFEKRSNAVARDHGQEFVEGIPVSRKWLVPADQIFRLRDHFHRPVFIAARCAEDIDEYGDPVIGEFSCQFGVFELFFFTIIQPPAPGGASFLRYSSY